MIVDNDTDYQLCSLTIYDETDRCFAMNNDSNEPSHVDQGKNTSCTNEWVQIGCTGSEKEKY